MVPSHTLAQVLSMLLANVKLVYLFSFYFLVIMDHHALPTPNRQTCRSHVMIPIRTCPICQNPWGIGWPRIGIIT